MDPDETLRLARFAAKDLGKALDGDDPDMVDSAAADLLEYFEALDSWLSQGGFLPKKWAERSK